MAQPLLGGRYRIQRHLARGGMAEVYLARDELLDRPVAVKVLFPELARDASFVERFRREAQAAARLNHPNIVSVYDFGSDGEASYIVMEYISGRTLSDLIRAEAPMDPARAVAIAAAVAAGLDAAHREGIVHRDVKPANVLVADGVVKVADFGIARASYARSDLTMPGMVVGTSTYLSPEQARGGEVDQRSDVYSLALVLYEMLTGTAPFRGDNLNAIAYKQEHGALPPPSAVNPAVPPALDVIIARALSLDPAGRQASAAEFRAQIIDAGRGTTAPPAPPAPLGPRDPTVALPPGAAVVLPAGAAVAAGAGAAAAAAVGPGGTVVMPGAVADLPPGAIPPRARPRRPPPPPPPESNRGWLVALGLVLALIVAVIIAVALSSHHNPSTPTITTSTAVPTTVTTLPATTVPVTTPRTSPPTTTTTTTSTTVPPTTVAPTTVATTATTASTSPTVTVAPTSSTRPVSTT